MIKTILTFLFALSVFSSYSQFSAVPFIYGPFRFNFEKNKDVNISPDTEHQWHFDDGWVTSKRINRRLIVYQLNQNGQCDSIAFMLPFASKIEKLVKIDSSYYFILSSNNDGVFRLYKSDKENAIREVIVEFNPKRIKSATYLRTFIFNTTIDKERNVLYLVYGTKSLRALKVNLIDKKIEWDQQLALTGKFDKLDCAFIHDNKLIVITHTPKEHSSKYYLSELDDISGLTKTTVALDPNRLITIDMFKFSKDRDAIILSGISTKNSYFNRIKTHDPYIAKIDLNNYKMTFNLLPESLKGKNIIWQDIIDHNADFRLIGETFERETKELAGGAVLAATFLVSTLLTRGEYIVTASAFRDIITTRDVIDISLNKNTLDIHDLSIHRIEKTSFDAPYIAYHEGIIVTSFFRKFFRYSGYYKNIALFHSNDKLYKYDLANKEFEIVDFENRAILDYGYDIMRPLLLPVNGIVMCNEGNAYLETEL